ncbi:MAG: multidrug transporter [Cellvibrionaceae bacterium]|nr:multidrug transporter [Cellvibrionaceae bacterium]
MSKQLLIYSRAQAVNSQRHREWSVKAGDNFEFARDVNSVPLTAVEFVTASSEYPIVFAGSDDQLMPLVVMGVRDKENLYMNEDGTLDAKYVPAFLRRYPFVFSSQDDGKNFTLCIDETFDGCNQDNVGERLFDAEGEKTQYLNNVLEFLKEYQLHFSRTQAFCKKLQELELLEPMGAQFTPPQGEKVTLTGFFAINRKKLKELAAEDLEQLVKNDGMELIFLHLYSLRNFNTMLSKIGVSEDAVPTE